MRLGAGMVSGTGAAGGTGHAVLELVASEAAIVLAGDIGNLERGEGHGPA